MSYPQDSSKDISQDQNERNPMYDDILREAVDLADDMNILYIVTTHKELSSVIKRLKEYSAHFENTRAITLSVEKDLSEIEPEIQQCINSHRHCMCILSSQNTFHEQLLQYHESFKEPSNLGNCSTDGREIWNVHTGFNIDPNEFLFLSNVIQIGLQLQLTPPQLFDELDKEYYEYYRIGHFKNEIEEVEPIMRDLNIFQLSCNTIRNADFPAKYDHNPSGFLAEEALQLIKYASVSPYLRFLLLHDIDPDHLDPASIEFLAQAIWYTTHGVDVRLDDSPYNLDKMQEYIVDHDYYDFPISFLKSKLSGRWWIKIPNFNEDRAPFVCISCSEKDYLEVFEDRIPSRLIRAIERNR